MKLPKKALSFSQISLWKSSKEAYRKKYYPAKTPPYFQTLEMAFGNEVTEAMERNEHWVSFIPRHPVFEQKILVEIGGVPFIGYIDTMNPETIAFREQKTGRSPWTQKKVDKHIQMDIYSLLLEEHFGRVTDDCELVWVHAEKVKKTRMVCGHTVTGNSNEIRLTGKFDIFRRTITAEDRDNTRAMIVRVGREIEEDYAALVHLYR